MYEDFNEWVDSQYGEDEDDFVFDDESEFYDEDSQDSFYTNEHEDEDEGQAGILVPA